MTTTNPFVALFQASLPIYEQMRRDQARASEPVLALLQCLEANLFNPDCNVNFLKRKTGYRDNSVVLTFHSELGFTRTITHRLDRPGAAADAGTRRES